MSHNNDRASVGVEIPTRLSLRGRELWGLDMETVWVPFLRATNREGLTQIPDEYLNVDYSTGATVPKTVRGAIVIVKENFKVSLQQYAMHSKPTVMKSLLPPHGSGSTEAKRR